MGKLNEWDVRGILHSLGLLEEGADFLAQLFPAARHPTAHHKQLIQDIRNKLLGAALVDIEIEAPAEPPAAIDPKDQLEDRGLRPIGDVIASIVARATWE